MEQKRFSNQAQAILDFYQGLNPAFDLPAGVEIMHPFRQPVAWMLTQQFYRKFYSDREPRIFIFGINPGRFGGGVTGIPFTDPLRLELSCGISNGLDKKPELSSQFIYQVIEQYGGTEVFYAHFFITALCPLGFVKDGKNLNYYDQKMLLTSCEQFMTQSILEQLQTIRTSTATTICLGEGENFRQFSRLNERHHFFSHIEPLPHPRWIMQYRRKSMLSYVHLYVEQLKAMSSQLQARD